MVATFQDGRFSEVNSLKADGGWQEIADKLRELNPGDNAKMDEWNRAGAPEASHFFVLLSEKEAA